jgi:site-specific recombinase XerD
MVRNPKPALSSMLNSDLQGNREGDREELLRRRLVKQSITLYESKLKGIKEWMSANGIATLKKKNFFTFLLHLSNHKYAASTITGYRAAVVFAQIVLGQWLEGEHAWAQDSDMIRAAEGAGYRHKEGATQRLPLTQAHVDYLEERAASNDLKLAIRLLHGASLRIKELMRLEVVDLVVARAGSGQLTVRHDKRHGVGTSSKWVDKEFVADFLLAKGTLTEGQLFPKERLHMNAISTHIARVAQELKWDTETVLIGAHAFRHGRSVDVAANIAAGVGVSLSSSTGNAARYARPPGSRGNDINIVV